ncbi:hypothetical protein BDR06DRAFT_129693 [Suillus hirtellus]|nr:hypothetical protein BDR06DRAFT_129693 [Suillus hirtellus]
MYTRPTPGATRLFRMVVYIWLLGLASLTVTQASATSVVPWFSRHTIAGQAVFFCIVFLQSHRQGRIYRLDSGFHANRKIMINRRSSVFHNSITLASIFDSCIDYYSS